MIVHAEDHSGEGWAGPGGERGSDPERSEPPSDPRVDGPETVAEERLLASLRDRARSVNLSRVLRLLELLDDSDAGRLDEPGRREAEGLAHQVVGSAGTFGSPRASKDAVAVEEFFGDLDEVPRGRRRSRRRGAETVRTTLDQLRAEFGG